MLKKQKKTLKHQHYFFRLGISVHIEEMSIMWSKLHGSQIQCGCMELHRRPPSQKTAQIKGMDGSERERERESRCVLQLTDGHLRMKEKRDLRGTRAKRPRHTPSACPKASDL